VVLAGLLNEPVLRAEVGHEVAQSAAKVQLHPNAEVLTSYFRR
jgi:hypothetical protein